MDLLFHKQGPYKVIELKKLGVLILYIHVRVVNSNILFNLDLSSPVHTTITDTSSFYQEVTKLLKDNDEI